MFNLDPGKLLVIAVVAIILLGPDRLPQVARQVGAAWRSFNEFRHRLESEVRTSMPDLPPTSEIARLARSPSALLNHLSTLSPEEAEEADGSFQPHAAANGKADADTNGSNASNGSDASNGSTAAAGATQADGPNTPNPVTPPTNGAGRHEPEGESAAQTEPMPTAPRWAPAATQAREPIVPGDPTLN